MEKFRYLAKDKISKLPKTVGVYAFLARRLARRAMTEGSLSEGGKKDGAFLYIGKAVNLLERAKQHKALLSRTKQLAYIKTKSEDQALILENKLIKKYQPKYNTQWKDDKNYFYAGITKEEYPRVFVTHQPNGLLKPGFNKLVETWFLGPFTNGRELKQALRELRKIHPYRTCHIIPKKPCLWYHLKQCPAPCLPAEALAKAGLQHIEAYDISNIQGQQATGSMVTFKKGRPDKNFYRKFKIKMENKPNDVAMMREVLTRRFNHPEWPYPDSILIDGGKAQLNVAIKSKAQSTKSKNIKVMTLAKRNNELFIEGQKNPILLKNLPNETANLILRARDEAHRFARKYHHYLRDKALLD